MMGAHGLNKKGYPLHYEEALRVPLAVAGPGITSGTRPEGLVSLLDLMPTLADLAGVALDSPHQGQSHRAALEGDPGWTGRPYLLAESFRIDGNESGTGDAVGPEDFDPARDGINLSIRTPTHRYIWRLHDHDELYYHRTDPGENTNLAQLPESAGLRHELGHLIAASLDEAFPGVAQRIREEVRSNPTIGPTS
jgi:arylsulfatase A-like enzyme